jgi:hypothetical protein
MLVSNCFSKKNISMLVVLFVAAALNVNLALASSGTTPHGSEISNQMDPALIGTWDVLQVQIEGAGGLVMVLPTHGAQVTWLDSGSYKVDYQFESNGPRATDISAGEMISPSTASPVSTCKMRINGYAIGASVVSLAGGTAAGNVELRAKIDLSASERPEVKCEGSNAVIGNMTTPPIGAGKPTLDADGQPFVSYYYTMDSALTNMEIWSVLDNLTRTRYFLRKMN